MNLGKKIVPEVKPKPDVIEKVGDVWKLNGKFQTNKPEQPQSPDFDPFKELRDAIKKQEDDGWLSSGVIQRNLQQQEDDGFPLYEFGVL